MAQLTTAAHFTAQLITTSNHSTVPLHWVRISRGLADAASSPGDPPSSHSARRSKRTSLPLGRFTWIPFLAMWCTLRKRLRRGDRTKRAVKGRSMGTSTTGTNTAGIRDEGDEVGGEGGRNGREHGTGARAKGQSARTGGGGFKRAVGFAEATPLLHRTDEDSTPRKSSTAQHSTK